MPEILQDNMEQLLQCQPGVEVIMDDIIIHGETRAKHDEHYENVPRVIRASWLKLNKDAETVQISIHGQSHQ